MKRRAFLVSAASSLLAAPAWSADDGSIAVIVHRGVGVAQLDRDELRTMFQVARTEWAGGGRILPLNLPASHELRRAFDRAVLGLEPDQVARYWIDRKIRGDARVPRTLPSTAVVLRAVAATAGAISYVQSNEANDSVRVVARIRGGKVVRA